MTSTVIQASEAMDLEDAAVARKKHEASDRELVARLVDQARAEGLELVGENGLLNRLTKLVLESALEGELTDHLGYDKHDPAGRGSGNTRNGTRTKTVITDVGPVEIDVPRDRDASFEPKIVRKRQRRLSGVDEMVISLAAKGLTTGEISAHLAEVYGAEVSKQTISTITDRVLASTAGASGTMSAEAEALKRIPDADVNAALAALPEGFAEVVYLAFVAGHARLPAG